MKTKKITFTFELDFLEEIMKHCKADFISIQDRGYELFRNHIAEQKLRKKNRIKPKIKRG